jgi:type I restriction enzyme S subunit
MDERGKVKIENAPKLDLSESDYDRYRVEQGDLLITRTGSIGTLAIFQDDCRAIPGAYLLHYKFTQGSVNPAYIYLVFKSPEIQKTLTGSTQGIGRPNLNAPTLEAIPFNLPSLVEQREILNIANEKIEAMNRLENEIDSKIKMAKTNKQAVLASAFSGGLASA